MTRPKVLLMGPMPYIRDRFFAQVSPLAEIQQLESRDYVGLKEDFKTKHAAVKAIYHFRDPGSFFGHLGAQFFECVPESCKVVSHLGAGYDDIDVSAATARGIKVTHTPGAVDEATATTAVYLIVSAMRQFARAEIACRDGNWKRELPLARDPERKVLGIVGMGGIGTVVARRMALGWGMGVVYHNRSRLSQEPQDFKMEYKENLDDLLREADVVSLHIPANAATHKLFNAKRFEAMKDGAVLVNTARGSLVDEDALLQELDKGRLHGVGLDVYPEEPKVNPELFKYPNVTLLPHMGTETWDSRDEMALMVMKNILACLKDEPLPNIVPEQRS